jgi:hypothetical protein
VGLVIFPRNAELALSSQPDIFRSANAATASSKGSRMAARHEVAFSDPNVFDLDIFLAGRDPKSKPIVLAPVVQAMLGA